MPAVEIAVTQNDVTSLYAVTNQIFATAAALPARVGEGPYGSYTSPVFSNSSGLYLLRGRGYASEDGTYLPRSLR